MPHTPRGITALVLASHPLPTASVTAMMIGLLAGAGNPARVVAIGALAVLAGQLSIGWSNDAIDARRDEISDRSDKPVARGDLTAASVMWCAVAAAGSCVVFSLLLGWRAGTVHLVGVGCGWAYNLGLKGTVWSPAPFAVAFGGLPAVATLALPDHPWPPLWALLSGALIGVAAHFANVAPDIADDREGGVLGLPQRLGEQWTAAVALGAALAACAIVTFADTPDPLRLTAFGVAIAVALVGAAVFGRRGGEAAFIATIAIAAIGVLLLATSEAFPTS